MSQDLKRSLQWMFFNLICFDSPKYVFPLGISLLLLAVFTWQLPNSYQACSAYLSTHLLHMHTLHCYPCKSHPYVQNWRNTFVHWEYFLSGISSSLLWHYYGTRLSLSLCPFRFTCWIWCPLKTHPHSFLSEFYFSFIFMGFTHL